MRPSTVLFAEKPPESQLSPSHSIPHRKKKRKHRASPVETNLIQEAADSSSVSSETGRTSNANGCDELYSHVHDACEEMPKPLRQRSVNSGGSFADSTVTAVDDGYGKEGSSVGVATSETVEPLDLNSVLAEDSS
ncbi:hypothetical protein SESBI_36427, partial [Sesbania bispinosa]